MEETDMSPKDLRRIQKAAESVARDEKNSLAKFISITGKIPVDRVPGYQTRYEFLAEMRKK